MSFHQLCQMHMMVKIIAANAYDGENHNDILEENYVKPSQLTREELEEAISPLCAMQL